MRNLPTIWSNCLAGWWLGGGGNVSHLIAMLIGVSLLYVGGSGFLDNFDKGTSLGPITFGLRRFALYLIAALISSSGINGWVIWCGLAMAAYTTGIGFFARAGNAPTPVRYWPLIFLSAPFIVALVMNTGIWVQRALLLEFILAAWIVRSLAFIFRDHPRDVNRTVSGLMAGIVWVDLIAALDFPAKAVWIFPALFILTVVLNGRNLFPARN